LVITQNCIKMHGQQNIKIITYSECVCVCVCVAWIIQHPMCKCRIVLLSVALLLYHIFPLYLIKGTIFAKTLLNIKRVFYFSLQLLSKTLPILEEFNEILPQMYVSRNVKCRLFLSDLIKLEFVQQIFEKYSNIKFHENPSSGSRVVPSGKTRWTKGSLFAVLRTRLIKRTWRCANCTAMSLTAGTVCGSKLDSLHGPTGFVDYLGSVWFGNIQCICAVLYGVCSLV
jgi:hypothetical protein